MSDMLLPLAYLGDSHVRYFRRAAYLGLLGPRQVNGVEVGGATAVGMRNPNSKTNALKRFRSWICDQPRETMVLLHLGEVDCGFVVWHRAEKYAESVDDQLSASISAYEDFVDELIDSGFSRIVITGATLPTITDDDQSGDVVQKRSSISATQIERTKLTLRYNSRLEGVASERRLPYVDVAPWVIDPETGLVSNRMRNSNPEDHHMNSNLAAVYWAERLTPAFECYQGSEYELGVWRCVRDTYLKAYPAHSRNLPDDLRLRIGIGDTVKGEIVSSGPGAYILLKSARVNGRECGLLRLFHPEHFTRLA